jgi:glucokinase
LSADNLLLGIDVGGTKTAVVVGDVAGAVRARAEFPSLAARGPDALIADIEHHVARLAVAHPGAAAIGVSIGGPVDAESGLVMSPPNLPGWDAIPLAERLARRFGLPTRLEHDAKAGALAEWRYGAGRGARDMVFLTLGTGIGAGIIAGGRLVRGAGNLAGEVGHWRIAADGPEIYGKAGSLEGWASGAGLPALARFLHPVTLGDIADAIALSRRAEAGDAAASEVIAAAGAALGRALALLVDLLAPERIVLGNLARRLGPAFMAAAEAELTREALPALVGRCRLLLCELGDRIGDMAALAVAATALEERTCGHAAQ